MQPVKLTLTAADHIIIATTMIISSLIGLLFQLKSKNNTNKEFLFAGKNMSLVPVIISITAAVMSSTTLMGLPVDTYLYGTNMFFVNVGIIIGPIIATYVFLPVYFASDISTVYEYLEKRFGRTLRRIQSAVFMFLNILFNAATLYAPALALSAVTEITIWVSIIAVGVVCTFYSTLGGMKAVIWTDTFQGFLMFTCLFAIIIKGAVDLHGIGNVFQKAYDGGRILLPKFSVDMISQYTMPNIVCLSMIISTSLFGGNQLQVQRLLTLKNLSQSKKAALWSIPLSSGFHMLCCLTGLILYAYFQDCDPLSAPNKPIQAADQLMPYFIAKTMQEYPGLPGLCIAGIFSCSLSTISTILNSLAAVTIEDFIRPIKPNIPHEVLLTKIASLIYGAICIAFSFVVGSFGSLIKINSVILGMFAGTNLGVFILAACTKNANEQGTIIGFVASFAVGLFLTFIPKRQISALLPLSNDCPEIDIMMKDGTPFVNMTTTFYSSHLTPVVKNSTMETKEEKFEISLAYMWIGTISFLVCLIVGYFSSIIIACFQKEKPDVPDKYLSPVRTWFTHRNAGIKENGVEGKYSERREERF